MMNALNNPLITLLALVVLKWMRYITYPDSFDDTRWEECSHGIHCFLTREEAINYKL
jgi:hypothetical protein